MIKHVLALITVSILIVLFMPYAQQGVQGLVYAHDWVSDILTEVFSGGQAGNIVRSLIGLLALPLFAGLIPAGIYWLIRKSWLPCFMEIVWVVWLVQAGALIIIYSPQTGI